MSITQLMCLFVALGMQCARAILSSVAPDPLYNIFPLYLIKAQFSEKLLNTYICFDYLYNFVRNISHSKKKWARYDKMFIGTHVKYPLLVPM
jgi:hypothetical protein